MVLSSPASRGPPFRSGSRITSRWSASVASKARTRTSSRGACGRTLHRVGVEVDESRALAVRTSRWRRLRPGDWAVRLGAIAVVLGVWELFGPTLNKLILRPPSDIFRAFFELVANGELQDAMAQSFRELFGGLAVALALGLVLGVASGRWRFVYNAIDPLVSALYDVPSVALVPLIAVAFRSVGDAPRIATVALFAVFPILINT